jgi:hypothetical protein
VPGPSELEDEAAAGDDGSDEAADEAVTGGDVDQTDADTDEQEPMAA